MMNTRTTATAGSLLLIAITMFGCGGSSSASPSSPTSSTSDPYSPPGNTPAPTTADVTITVAGMNGSNSYSPNPATVKAGQTVSWYNGDSLPHTATADTGAFNTGTINPGATSSPIKMSTAGTFPYHCLIHGTAMTGTLVVTP